MSDQKPITQHLSSANPMMHQWLQKGKELRKQETKVSIAEVNTNTHNNKNKNNINNNKKKTNNSNNNNNNNSSKTNNNNSGGDVPPEDDDTINNNAQPVPAEAPLLEDAGADGKQKEDPGANSSLEDSDEDADDIDAELEKEQQALENDQQGYFVLDDLKDDAGEDAENAELVEEPTEDEMVEDTDDSEDQPPPELQNNNNNNNNNNRQETKHLPSREELKLDQLTKQREEEMGACIGSSSALEAEQFVTDFKVFCAGSVTEKSQKQYLSNKRMITNRGYDFDTVGVLKMMMSTKKKDLALSNASLACILSALRYDYFCRFLETMPEKNNLFLSKALAVRRRRHPDHKRVTGAMTAERTEKFVEYLGVLATEKKITKEDKELFEETAWTLYGCALRVFQLKDLKRSSFYEVEVEESRETDKDGKVKIKKKKELFVAVTAKGAERLQRQFERKQVSPTYSNRIRKIVQKRQENTQLFCDFTDSKRATFAKLVGEAAAEFDWPSSNRFTGTHMFRHGAAQDAFRESDCDLKVVKMRTGHLSKAAAEFYARSDLERNDKEFTKVKYSGLNHEDRRKEEQQRIATKIHEADLFSKDQLAPKLKAENRLFKESKKNTKKNNNNNNNSRKENSRIFNDDDDSDDEFDTGVEVADNAKNQKNEATAASKKTLKNELLKSQQVCASVGVNLDQYKITTAEVVVFPQLRREPLTVIDERGADHVVSVETLRVLDIKKREKMTTDESRRLQGYVNAAAALRTRAREENRP